MVLDLVLNRVLPTKRVLLGCCPATPKGDVSVLPRDFCNSLLSECIVVAIVGNNQGERRTQGVGEVEFAAYIVFTIAVIQYPVVPCVLHTATSTVVVISTGILLHHSSHAAITNVWQTVTEKLQTIARYAPFNTCTVAD